MLLDQFSLTDKVAIVTGAGRGIGAACALGFAEAGADVVIASRTKEQLEDVAFQVSDRGRRALGVPCDVNETANLELLVGPRQAGLARGVQLRFELGWIGDRVHRRALEGPGEQTLPDRRRSESKYHLATGGAVGRRPSTKPVDAHHRGRAGHLLDRHDLVGVQDVQGHGFADDARELLTNGPGHKTQVELPGDDARQLR